MRSVLDSLPLYYFSLFRAPKKVIKSLVSVRRKFLWGGIEDKGKIHWVAWDVVTRPNDKGGLGIVCLKSLNISLLIKWSWRLKVKQNGFWLSCIKSILKIDGADGNLFARYGIPELAILFSK